MDGGESARPARSRTSLRLQAERRSRLADSLRRARASKAHGKRVAAELRRRGDIGRAERLEGCSSWVLFREWLLSDSVVLRAADFCQQRKLCPGCARASARATVARTSAKVAALLAGRDLMPVMVTLTQRTGADLPERLANLLAGLKRANQHRRDVLRGKGSSAFAPVAAAVWHVEIKRARRRLWHAHIHGLVLLPRGVLLDLPQLRAEWAACVGQRTASVDARITSAGRRMLCHDLPFARLPEEAQGRIVRDLVEVLKYPVKFARDLTARDVVDVHQVTHRRPLLRTWGDLRGVRPLAAAGDAGGGSGPYIDRIFRFHGGAYRQVAAFPGEED